MDVGNGRRSFFKYLLSFLAFSAGSMLSFKRSIGSKIDKLGPTRAHAMGNGGKRIKKIAVEEHASMGLEDQIEERLLLSPSKQPERVMARSDLSYWAVRELGICGTAAGERLGLSQSAVNRAVQRGERLVSRRHLSLKDD